MRHLFTLLFITALTVGSWANNPSPFKELPKSVYVVQIGAFANPSVSELSAINNIGYLYTEKVGKVQRVLLGRYENASEAKSALAAVQASGFTDAFIDERAIKAEDMVYSVQLITYEAKQQIDWTRWLDFNNLHVYLTDDGKVRILTDIASNLTDINRVLQSVRDAGVEGAFIKEINRGLIHQVSGFEIKVNQRKMPVIGHDIGDEGLLSGDIAVKGGEIMTVKPSDVPVSYEQFNTTSRSSVKQLQSLLAENSNFKGQNSGVYDRTTNDAFQMFEEKNDRYAQYKVIAQSKPEVSFKGGLQSYVDLVYANPLMAYGGLKEENHPMADVYLAYMYFTDKANPKGQDKQQLINDLMNNAVKRIFITGDFKGTTELDFTKTYNYDNILLIIQHLSYMQDAMQDPPSLPCWLFENHPKEAATMFNRLYSMVSGCGDFMEWEELKILQTIAEDLDPVNHKALGKADENIKMAYDSRRAQLYLAPNISQAEAMVMETWNKRLWESMEKWSKEDPLHQKMVTPLQMSYFRAMVKLENHYMGRGFNETEARVLSLSVLRTVVNYHLSSYVK